MRRLVVIVLALALLIGGGGGAAYFFFLRPNAVPETPEQMAARLKKEAEEKEKERMNAPVNWHEMPAIPAPVVINGRVRAYLFLGLKLDMAQVEAGNKIDEEGAALTEKLLIELTERPIKMVEGTTNPDLVEVKQRLKTLLENEIGKDSINDVLITMTFLQPF